MKTRSLWLIGLSIFNNFNCIANNQIQIKSLRPILTIGHRGFAGKYAENSLQSFSEALKLGLNGVELDVWVCKTGELIVFHDATLARMTNGKGKISQKTFAQLRKLKLPNGELIPTLEEVLNLINHRCMVNIELKGPNTAEPTAKLLTKFMQKGWRKQDFVISSFNHQELQKFHQLLPGIAIGALFERLDTLFSAKSIYANTIKKVQKMSAQYLVIDYQDAPKISKLAQAVGLKVWVYTVDAPSDIAKMRALGVDGIISDLPNLVLQK